MSCDGGPYTTWNDISGTQQQQEAALSAATGAPSALCACHYYLAARTQVQGGMGLSPCSQAACLPACQEAVAAPPAPPPPPGPALPCFPGLRNWRDVRDGTLEGLAEVGARVSFQAEVRHTWDNSHTPSELAEKAYWNGLGVFVVAKG